MSITEYNRASVLDAMGPEAKDFGGGGTGFAKFNQHMAAFGVNVVEAPDASIASGPEQDRGLDSLIMGGNKATPPKLGG